MPCTTCDTYYDASTVHCCDAPIRWLSPGAVCAGPGALCAVCRLQRTGVWCETCNCVVRVLICECVREELRNKARAARCGVFGNKGWCEIIGNRGVCSRGGHDIRVPTKQETAALNVKKLKALQTWRRDLKNELLPELLRAHDANRAEIAKKILLYVGFDHPWKIY